MFSVGQVITKDQAMKFAVEIAKLGRGFVSPNPLVGCVIVDKDHKFLASGSHLRYGGPHAEINAVRHIEDSSKLIGASVYVTLEPCAHRGNTGSCAEALSTLPIQKVFYGIKDPNPLVAGKGLEILTKNGKETWPFGKYEKECQEVCEQFLYHISAKLPYVSLKVATSLDGKIALNSGESQWITGEEARIYGRTLRAHYDATLIGAGTLERDDPTLDFRGTGFENQKENKVVILDPKGQGATVFKKSKIQQKHELKNVFVLTKKEHFAKWSENLVHVFEWEPSQSSWRQALKNLYNKGIYSIYVEGGSYVFGQMLEFQLSQKLYLFQSSKILGEAMSWTNYLKIPTLEKAPSFKQWKSFPMGEDRLNILYW